MCLFTVEDQEEKSWSYTPWNRISVEAVIISRRFAIVGGVCMQKDQTTSLFEICGVILMFLWVIAVSDDQFE